MLKPYNKAELTFDILREIGQDGRNSRVFVVHDHQLNAEIVAKFRRITDGVITSERAAAIEETVLDLPHRSVSALVDLLGPEVGGFS